MEVLFIKSNLVTSGLAIGITCSFPANGKPAFCNNHCRTYCSSFLPILLPCFFTSLSIIISNLCTYVATHMNKVKTLFFLSKFHKHQHAMINFFIFESHLTAFEMFLEFKLFGYVTKTASLGKTSCPVRPAS